jgi:hypothetical protein
MRKLKRSKKINKNRIDYIRNRLSKSFPELVFVGGAYTLKMLDDDLKNLKGS